MGANLQYIIVNTFRRATVEHFSLAAVDPPFQAKGKGSGGAMLVVRLVFRSESGCFVDVLFSLWYIRADVAAEG